MKKAIVLSLLGLVAAGAIVYRRLNASTFDEQSGPWN
jgi:hypothetical protein